MLLEMGTRVETPKARGPEMDLLSSHFIAKDLEAGEHLSFGLSQKSQFNCAHI